VEKIVTVAQLRALLKGMPPDMEIMFYTGQAIVADTKVALKPVLRTDGQNDEVKLDESGNPVSQATQPKRIYLVET
jgi:hypothetical protein